MDIRLKINLLLLLLVVVVVVVVVALQQVLQFEGSNCG